MIMLPSLLETSPKASSSWLPRPECAAILQSLRDGAMVLVTAPRASGLTSVLATAADLGLGSRFVATCYVSGRDLQTLSPNNCFAALASRLGELLPLGWHPPACDDPISFRRFLFQLLAILPQPVVLVLDDMQSAPPAWLLSLLNLFRSIQYEKQFQPFWQKLACLLGTHELQRDHLDADSQSFLTCYRLQPVNQAEMTGWLATQPELASSHEARLTLAAWAGGNPVWTERLLRYAPTQGFTSPQLVASAAKRWVADQPAPELSADTRELLQSAATSGPQPATGLPAEQHLVDLGWLRLQHGQLTWSAPLAALYWKAANRAPKEPTEQPWLLLDQQRMEVRHLGRLLPLFPQELKILFLLASRPGQFFSAEQIYRQITDDPLESAIFAANVKAQIARLRKKLPSTDYLQTRRNVGYAFSTQLPFQLNKA